MICSECGGLQYRYNPTQIVDFITGDQFKREMLRQDAGGKHSDPNYVSQPIDWDLVISHAEGKSKGLPFVHVTGLPIEFLKLSHDPDIPSRVRQYSLKTTPYPPIFVSLTNYAIERDKVDNRPIRILVRNGNHRVAAALLRGDTSVDAYMNLETLRNIRLEFEYDILI